MPERFGEPAFMKRSASGEPGSGLAEALGVALEREQFVLEYQPQLELSSGRIVGAEALIRWRLPERGVVMPAEFIPLAERSGRIAEIGAWVIRTACMQSRSWRRAGIANLRVAVNVSAVQLSRGDIVDTVASALADAELEGSGLELEITEGVMIDPKRAVPVLERLQSLGVLVSIDDFGTGYSSFHYLRKMPINSIKIDRSFIQNLPDNAQDQAIVTAIVAMARRLGLRIIAEGVETADQVRFLRTLGCDEIQGYLVSPPISADRLTEMLRRNDELRFLLP